VVGVLVGVSVGVAVGVSVGVAVGVSVGVGLTQAPKSSSQLPPGTNWPLSVNAQVAWSVSAQSWLKPFASLHVPSGFSSWQN
jgi:hypothetical protein